MAYKKYVYREFPLYDDFLSHLGGFVYVKLYSGEAFSGVLLRLNASYDFDSELYTAYVTISDRTINIKDISYYNWR